MFRLALLLRKTVGELEAQMSSHELSEWLAFFRIHPMPDPALHTAMICSAVANSVGSDTTPEDFMPKYERAIGSSAEEAASAMQAWAMSMTFKGEKR